MFRSDTDALPTDPATPGGWALPGGQGPDEASWPGRGGFVTGRGGLAPLRPGDTDAQEEGRQPGGDGVEGARLDEDDDFEDDFYDEDEDDDDVFDDEEIDADDEDEDDLLDDDDDEDFDFEDD